MKAPGDYRGLPDPPGAESLGEPPGALGMIRGAPALRERREP